tara:strand:+ start:689 stop:1648 length:960 start_codon:yes stop_codon:yes gene_type:complete
MADIRIKDLPTTASLTASDDFIAIDGTTNGTRKLNSAAPSFLTSVTTPSLTSPASTPLTLGTGTSGAAITVLSADNNVGIGTTSPLDKFVVSNGGAQGLEIGATSLVIAQAYNRSGSAYVDYRDQCLNRIFYTNGSTQALTLSSTQAATFAGAVSVATGAAVGGATAGAGGLAFPATAVAVADANTLDDYEEGTWTPSFAGSTTNPTVTYASQSGSYTKIGRQVTVSFELGTSAQTGGVGTVQIAGLPFTIGVRVYAAVATFNINNSLSGPMGIFAEANAGGSNFALLATADNTSWTGVNYTDATSATIYVNGSFTYFV